MSANFFYNIKIGKLLSFSIYILIIFIVLSTSIINTFNEIKILTDEMEKRGISIATIVAKNAIKDVTSGNFTALKLILNQTKEQKESSIIYAAVLSTDGKVSVVDDTYDKYLRKADFSDAILNLESNLITDVELVFPNHKSLNVFDFTVPIFAYDKIWGFVKIGISKDILHTALYTKLFSTAAYFLIFTIIGFVLTLLIVRMITTPIKQLTFAADKMKNKDFSHLIDIKGKNELSILADTYNVMATEIKNYTENLEELVSKRTIELNRANKSLKHTNMMMKKDLKMAQKIQEAIIPKVFPKDKLLNLCGLYVPMDELGGDFYDVFKISDNKIVILIVDVCGHGVPAALITTMAKVSFVNFSKDNRTPAEITSLVNDELCRVIGEKDTYLTAFYCILDTEEKSITYTNAGHPEMYILKHDNEIIKLKLNSPIVGMMGNLKFSNDTYKLLETGDKIVFYTDGVIETRNKKMELYGEKRFKKLLLSIKNESPKKIIDTIKNELDNYKKDHITEDDITILICEIVDDNVERGIDIKIYESDIEENKSNKIIDFEKDYSTALSLTKSKDYNGAKIIALNLNQSNLVDLLNLE